MPNEETSNKLELIEEAGMTPETDKAIKKLLCECFPEDVEAFSESRYWHGSGPAYSLIYRQDNEVVGHVGIVLRTISCGGKQVDIAGIQSLAVSPRIQGTMVSWALMRRGMKEARKRGVPFGLLFCVPSLEKLYAAMKWKLIDIAVTMTDEEGNSVGIPGKNIAMVLDLSDQTFPKGDMDLQGADW